MSRALGSVSAPQSRSSVSFRFTHETNDSFKILEFNSDKITVSDLKILIAKATGLEREFARKFDLTLSLISTDDASRNEPLTDIHYVYPDSKIIVQRVAWHERPSIHHIAQTELPHEAWEEPEWKKRATKRPFPPEFICPLCHYVLDHPVVVRCVTKCGRSACRKCIEERFKERRICPFCQCQVQNVIGNKALAAIVNQLKLDSFDDVPQRPIPNMIKHQKSIESLVKSESHIVPLESSSSSSSYIHNELAGKQSVSILAIRSLLFFDDRLLICYTDNTIGTSLVPTSVTPFQEPAVSSEESVQLQRTCSNPLLKNPVFSTSHMSNDLLSNILVPSQELPIQSGISPPTQASPRSILCRSPRQTSEVSAGNSVPTVQAKTEAPLKSQRAPAVSQKSISEPPKRPYRTPLPPPLPSPRKGRQEHNTLPSFSPATVTGNYVFDPLSNSWRQAAAVQQLPGASYHPPAEVYHEKCPFTTIDDLVSRFPILSRKDFTILREFQRQVKLALRAEALSNASCHVAFSPLHTREVMSQRSLLADQKRSLLYQHSLDAASFAPVQPHLHPSLLQQRPVLVHGRPPNILMTDSFCPPFAQDYFNSLQSAVPANQLHFRFSTHPSQLPSYRIPSSHELNNPYIR